METKIIKLNSNHGVEKRRAETDKLAAIQAELSKGDKEKFQSFISDLEKLKTKYIFKSLKYKNLHLSINESIDEIITHSQSKQYENE